MEPVVHDGDRLLVDTGRKTPTTGEMAVLWDGGGLVVKRVEIVPRTDPPLLRLVSANPAYPPYTCLADEAHMIGTVLLGGTLMAIAEHKSERIEVRTTPNIKALLQQAAISSRKTVTEFLLEAGRRGGVV